MKFSNHIFDDIEEIERIKYLSEASWNYFGYKLQQVPGALLKLNRLLNSINFRRIIEIGAGDGGLSCLLANHCNSKGASFHSYDIHDKGINIAQLRKLTDGFEVKDVLFDEKNVAEVARLIGGEGQTLVICDAGKIPDFLTYSKYLKVGDAIMMHDFAADKTTFENEIEGRTWNWLEATYDDIREESEKNNIIHCDGYFSDVSWSFGWKGKAE